MKNNRKLQNDFQCTKGWSECNYIRAGQRTSSYAHDARFTINCYVNSLYNEVMNEKTLTFCELEDGLHDDKHLQTSHIGQSEFEIWLVEHSKGRHTFVTL